MEGLRVENLGPWGTWKTWVTWVHLEIFPQTVFTLRGSEGVGRRGLVRYAEAFAMPLRSQTL